MSNPEVKPVYKTDELPVEAETTYHMVGVFTGSSVKTYLNGTLMGEGLPIE